MRNVKYHNQADFVKIFVENGQLKTSQCDEMNANTELFQNHFVTSLFRLAQQKNKLKENPLLIKQQVLGPKKEAACDSRNNHAPIYLFTVSTECLIWGRTGS